jgi:hypothetical protein
MFWLGKGPDWWVDVTKLVGVAVAVILFCVQYYKPPSLSVASDNRLHIFDAGDQYEACENCFLLGLRRLYFGRSIAEAVDYVVEEELSLKIGGCVFKSKYEFTQEYLSEENTLILGDREPARSIRVAAGDGVEKNLIYTQRGGTKASSTCKLHGRSAGKHKYPITWIDIAANAQPGGRFTLELVSLTARGKSYSYFCSGNLTKNSVKAIAKYGAKAPKVTEENRRRYVVLKCS